MYMTTKTYKLLQCAGMAIGGTIWGVCAIKLYKEVRDDIELKGYDDGFSNGINTTFKHVESRLIELLGAEKGKEIWEKI